MGPIIKSIMINNNIFSSILNENKREKKMTINKLIAKMKDYQNVSTTIRAIRSKSFDSIKPRTNYYENKRNISTYSVSNFYLFIF